MQKGNDLNLTYAIILVTILALLTTLDYIPYAFLCYIPVIITFIYPFFWKESANQPVKKEISNSTK